MSKGYVSVIKWVGQLRSCYLFAVLVEFCDNDVWEMQLQRVKLGTLIRNMESESAACNRRLDDHHNCIAELYLTQQQLTVLIQELKPSRWSFSNGDDIHGLCTRVATLESQFERHSAVFASLVASCTEHNMKIESFHDECAFLRHGKQEPHAGLTKQSVESAHCKGRECGLQKKRLFRFAVTQISECRARSDEQHHLVTKCTSPLAEYRVPSPRAVPSVGSQQQAVSSVVSETDISSSSRRIKTEHAERSTTYGQEHISKPLQCTSKVENKCNRLKDAFLKESGLDSDGFKRPVSEEDARQAHRELQRMMTKMIEKKTACRKLMMSQHRNVHEFY